jgi:two-component system invasion response regulator UvrY
MDASMIRIALIDDHAVTRAGLRDFFADQEDFVVVAEAASGRQAVDIVRTGEVDVIVLDISMPDQNGMDALKAIKVRAPKLPVLILSALPEENYARMVLRWGASGYVSKTCEPAELVIAVRTVHAGRKYITALVAEQLAGEINTVAEAPSHQALTERELQVFIRLAKGENTRQVAAGMSLSPQTVSTYALRVKAKLNLQTNAELTYYALKNGMIQ